MGSPVIFNGKFSKLLTSKGVLKSDGANLENDGPKNYITYNNFENNATTGWSLGTTGTLTNAIPTGTPTFGSGTSNLTLGVTSSNQLRGSYSMSYTASAATTAGNMVASDAITIDSADQAKVLTFSFYYSVPTNPDNANWSGTSSNSFGVAVWDATPGSTGWLGVAGQFSMTQSKGVGIATGTFQTGASTSQIRLIVYNANATSGAITLYFDDFFVGPQVRPIGPVVTDWIDGGTTTYTTANNKTSTGSFDGSWVTNVSYTGKWRRVGDTMEVQAKILCNGAPTSATLTLSIPTGYSIDTTKNALGGNGQIGFAQAQDTGIDTYNCAVFYNSTTTVLITESLVAASLVTNGTTVTQARPFTFGSNDAVYVYFQVPISGWSSNVTLSSSNDTRVCAGRASGNAPSVAANTAIVWPTVDFDTHGAYSTSTGQWTVPITGYYHLEAYFNGAVSIVYSLYIANTISKTIATSPSGTGRANGSITFYATAGQTVDIRGSGTTGAQGTESWVAINRLSGPAVIAASETVAASYWASANGTSTSTAPVNFDSKEYDTHNAVTTGASWKFTAPVSGTYQVSTYINQVGAAASYFRLYKNSTSVSYKALNYLSTSAGGINAITAIKLNAGDYIGIYSSASINYFGNSSLSNDTPCHIDIVRVGN